MVGAAEYVTRNRSYGESMSIPLVTPTPKNVAPSRENSI
jgi:hypothetical protein